MIFNRTTIDDEVNSSDCSSLRQNLSGVEYQCSNGSWKSLVSHYNATFFASLFVENNFEKPGNYLLYGVGDGQIILELIEKNIKGTFYILESNMDILHFANDSFQILDHLEAAENISFCGSSEIHTIRAFLQSLPEDVTIRYYYPEVAAIPEEFSFLTEWFNNRMIDLNSGEKFNELVERNVLFNTQKKLPDFLRIFKGQFQETPVLILLSGPSLLDALPTIRSVQDHFAIISVGRNGQLCAENGIKPDLWVDIDPQERPELWERFLANDTTVPLAIMDSSSYMVHDYFKGNIGMVRSRLRAEDSFALPTGKSTVAAFALELALELGFGPVALVGQDLCYIGEQSHAQEAEVKRSVHFTDNSPKLLCNDGIERYSSKEFIRHKESIQEVVKRQGGDIYTVSSQGAKLEGISFLPLETLCSLGSDLLKAGDVLVRLQKGLNGEEF